METKEVRIRCFGHWRDMLDFEYGAARKNTQKIHGCTEGDMQRAKTQQQVSLCG